MARDAKAKAKRKAFIQQIAKEVAEQIVDESDGDTLIDRGDSAVKAAADTADTADIITAAPAAGTSAAGDRIPQEAKGSGMRGFSFFLALISFLLLLLLGYVVYDMNGKVTRLAATQNTSQSAMTRDLAAARTVMDKVDRLDESIRSLRASLAKISADNLQAAANIKDNAVAIDEMKRRFNLLVDAVK